MGCVNGKQRHHHSAQHAAALSVIANDAPAPLPQVKIVVMGDKATGKSSLVMRFTKGSFYDVTSSTIGAAFASKDVPLPNGKMLKLQLWDTAGEELFRAMTRSFFRDAAGAGRDGECCAIQSYDGVLICKLVSGYDWRNLSR